MFNKTESLYIRASRNKRWPTDSDAGKGFYPRSPARRSYNGNKAPCKNGKGANKEPAG